MQLMLITVAESPASWFQPDRPVLSSQAASRRTHLPHPAFQPHWPVCFNVSFSFLPQERCACFCFPPLPPRPIPFLRLVLYSPTRVSLLQTVPSKSSNWRRLSPTSVLVYHSPFISLKKKTTICSFIHWPFLLNKHKTPWRDIIFVAFKVIHLYQWVENVLVQCVHNNSLLNK